MKPEISYYSPIKTPRTNARREDYPGLITLWYSYDTVIAYRDDKDGLVVSQNVWSTTTGKHLNAIDGGNKSARLPRETFKAKLKAALQRANL